MNIVDKLEKIFFMVAFLTIFCTFSYSYSINLRNYILPQIPAGYLYNVQEDNGETGDKEIIILQEINSTTGFPIIRRYCREQPPVIPEVFFGEFTDLTWEDSGLFIYQDFEYDEYEESTNITFDPPALFIPATMEEGEEINTDLHTVKLISTNDIIDVPVGYFTNCMKLEITGGDDGNETIWFVPGIGEIKSIDNFEGDTETRELVAARIKDNIIGDTSVLGCGQDISFVFVTPLVQGSSIILDGIFVRGYTNTFWAKFDFNLNTLSFDLDPNNIGMGIPTIDNINTTSMPGLKLDAELPSIFPCEKGARNIAYLFIKAEYNGHVYYLEFSFNSEKLSFDLIKIWDEYGTQII